MNITDIRIRKTYTENRLRALVSITVDYDLAVHDIKVIEGPERLFVAMPSRKDENGSFRDIAHPITPQARKQLEDAQAGDPALTAFLDGLGQDTSDSSIVSDGTTLVVTEDCNVRAAASSDADIIGGLSAGEEVQKLGSEGDWIQVEYEGQTAYIYSGLLEEKTE